MVQTFTVDVAASTCPPLTVEEVEIAIFRAMCEKERAHGMGSINIDVQQTFTSGTKRC